MRVCRPAHPLRSLAVAAVDLREKIRDIPDFPRPGIVFKDIMPLLADANALRSAVDQLAEWAQPRDVDYVVGAEARGFILGSALAYRLGCGFVAAREPGKLSFWALKAGETAGDGTRLARVARGAAPRGG